MRDYGENSTETLGELIYCWLWGAIVIPVYAAAFIVWLVTVSAIAALCAAIDCATGYNPEDQR